MNQTTTVESRVLEIMRGCPRSRYDDMELATQYYSRYGHRKITELPLGYVMFNYKRFGLPCFETIRRARQRVQSLFPELSRNTSEPENTELVLLIQIGG